jgi:hypothetical protein
LAGPATLLGSGGDNPPGSSAMSRTAVRDAGKHAGLRAVSNLRAWLHLTVADVAALTGIAPSTVYWWANHPGSMVRPATVDRLLALEALASGLVDELGEEGARRWFRFGSPSRLDRLRSDPVRNDPLGLAVIEAEGYDFLLGRARQRLREASQ